MEILISISFVGMFGLLLWLRHGGYIERIYFPAESRFRREAWRSAARAAGLTGVVETSRDLSGWAGRVHVRLSRYETEVSGTRLVLSGPGLAGGFTVRPEALETTLRAAVGQREVEIGDETFDRLAWIQGSPALAHALLDRPAREAFRSVFGGYLQRAAKMPFLASALLDDGTLSLDVPEVPKRKGTTEGALDALFAAITGKEASEGGSLGRPERLPEVLEAALAFARRLEPPADVARRIAENLRDEPMPGVRVRSLTVLAREFPDHPATREALLAARKDPDAEVRLRAAAELGEEGRDVLLALAEGEGAEDATTARGSTTARPGGFFRRPCAPGGPRLLAPASRSSAGSGGRTRSPCWRASSPSSAASWPWSRPTPSARRATPRRRRRWSRRSTPGRASCALRRRARWASWAPQRPSPRSRRPRRAIPTSPGPPARRSPRSRRA